MSELAIFAIALLATTGGVALFKRYGAAAGMLDVPNERSSHVRPTPRGGGIVLVLVCLAVYCVSAAVGVSPIKWAYVTGALIVAAISWLDDVYGVHAFLRLLVHAVAAVIVIWGCGPLTSVYLPVGESIIYLGALAPIITFLWIVWLINAYNFMDGIDGIAGAQALVAGLGWAAFGYFVDDRALYLFAGAIAFSSLGFLIHNWTPASVFMGDVGSAFLGLTFATMPLLLKEKAAIVNRGWIMTAAIAFLWLFVFDSVFTFARRVLKRERFWVAHRQHLYQRLIVGGSGHGHVSLIYAFLGSIVISSFFAAFLFRGIWETLFLFLLVAASGLVVFLAVRKKV